MTGEYSCISKIGFTSASTDITHDLCRNTESKQAQGRVLAGICLESGALLRPSHNGLPARAGGGGRAVNRDQQALILTKKKRPGLACANPSRLSRGRFRPNPLYA